MVLIIDPSTGRWLPESKGTHLKKALPYSAKHSTLHRGQRLLKNKQGSRLPLGARSLPSPSLCLRVVVMVVS